MGVGITRDEYMEERDEFWEAITFLEDIIKYVERGESSSTIKAYIFPKLEEYMKKIQDKYT